MQLDICCSNKRGSKSREVDNPCVSMEAWSMGRHCVWGRWGLQGKMEMQLQEYDQCSCWHEGRSNTPFFSLVRETPTHTPHGWRNLLPTVPDQGSPHHIKMNRPAARVKKTNAVSPKALGRHLRPGSRLWFPRASDFKCNQGKA